MPIIKLKSEDGVVFDVDVEVAKISGTIKTMLDNLGFTEDEDDIIPLPNLKSNILKLIIEWATKHKDDEPMEEDIAGVRRSDDIPTWDVDFLKVDQGTLFELILAANYLDIKGLLAVTTKTVANMMKGKTPGEIRTLFNIADDFEPGHYDQQTSNNDIFE